MVEKVQSVHPGEGRQQTVQTFVISRFTSCFLEVGGVSYHRPSPCAPRCRTSVCSWRWCPCWTCGGAQCASGRSQRSSPSRPGGRRGSLEQEEEAASASTQSNGPTSHTTSDAEVRFLNRPRPQTDLQTPVAGATACRSQTHRSAAGILRSPPHSELLSSSGTGVRYLQGCSVSLLISDWLRRREGG